MDLALTITLVVTILCFTGIWLINVMTKDAGVIDYYWGPGFAVIAGVHMVIHGSGTLFEWILLLAVALWAMRLAGYLVHRHHGSTAEDGRYLEMRESGGPNFWWTSLFKVFTLQAVLLWMIASPLHVAFGSGAEAMPVLFWFGMAIFIGGFAFEWVADSQLAAGKAAAGHNNTGNSMFKGGLWGQSRHPNYFGEIILWWGLALAAFAMSGAYVAFVGPLLLTVVILAVSLPLTEQHMLKTREGYAEYQRSVPKLLPFTWGKQESRQPAE